MNKKLRRLEQAEAERIAKLEKEARNYKAFDILTLKTASANLAKSVRPRYMASGVIVTITDLEGKEIVGPVIISDGLSNETVAALNNDIRVTYDMRVALSKF